MTGRRRIVRWAAAIALVAVGATVWAVGSLEPSSGSWAVAERGDLVLSVEVTGKLRATRSSLLGPPQLRDYWEYKIAHMTPEGEVVEAGAPVLAFDTSDLRQKLDRQLAEAEEARKQIDKTSKNLEMNQRRDELRLAEAEARLRKAQLKLDRPEDLAEARELEEARLDLELARLETDYLRERLAASKRSAEAQLAALRNQRDRAEQRVEEIRRAMEDMVRKAPLAGTVIYATNWRDEKKKVGDTCWRAESVIELPDLNEMAADGSVDEADAGKLVAGQRVSLRLDAHPDAEFHGEVTSIWKTVQRESWRNPLKVARLEIALEETDTRRMRPGMRFRGRIETERVEGAVLIPLEAIFRTDAGPVVYRRTWLGAEAVPVELGRRNEQRVEVLAGLAAGDSVSLVDPDDAS